ncbi:MAG: hypothetical protein ACLGI2_13560 [Acidimicrobiia bacterium]
MRTADAPYLPVAQTVYRVQTSLLPVPDPETHRTVVVLAAPAAVTGTVAVVARSSADGFGVEHGPDPRLGLTSPGTFSRRLAVQAELWSPSLATPLGRLDDATFAAVTERFGS